MIALLTGTPLHRDVNRCIVDVNGVGYEVYATNRGMDAWFAKTEAVKVHVSTHVREDAITLYGFSAPEERTAFQVLMGVSGVGPKVALATLDTFTVAELVQAIETANVPALGKISGVGKKMAQRMALELKGKIVGPVHIPTGTRTAPASAATDPLVLALERLGYSRAEIANAVAGLEEQGIGRDTPVAERLRAALKLLYAS